MNREEIEERRYMRVIEVLERIAVALEPEPVILLDENEQASAYILKLKEHVDKAMRTPDGHTLGFKRMSAEDLVDFGAEIARITKEYLGG